MSLNNFLNKQNKDDIVNRKYPLIWKVESCLKGECRGERTSHRWSVPTTTPQGLVTECYDCHVTKVVYSQCQTKITTREEEKNINI